MMRWSHGITNSMDMSLSKFRELRKVGHDWTIELNWTEKIIWEVDYIRVICPWAEEMPMSARLKPWGHLLWFFYQTVEIALAPSTYCLLFPFLKFLLLYATSATYFISFSILPSMLHLLLFFFSPKLTSPNFKWSKVVSMYLIDWVYLLRMISLWNVLYRSNWFHFTEWIIMSSVTFLEKKNYLGD